MSALRGGERVVITHKGRTVHIFERSMSDELQQLRADDEDDTPVIDLWRLVTPMSAKQKRKLPPLPNVRSLPPAERAQAIWERNERFKARERINSRTRAAKVEYAVTDDLMVVKYDLGYGIRPVGMWKLWDILDDLARAGSNRIDALALDKKITGG